MMNRFQALLLIDETLSNLAFNCNVVRLYTEGGGGSGRKLGSGGGGGQAGAGGGDDRMEYSYLVGSSLHVAPGFTALAFSA